MIDRCSCAKPKSIVSSWRKLRASKPAPASMMSASAICDATSQSRVRRRRRDSAPPRVSSRSGDASRRADRRERRQHAEQQHGKRGHAERGAEQARVHLDVVEAGQIGRRERHERSHEPRGARHAEHAAGDGHHAALDHELTHQRARTRAERAPHRQLARARPGAQQEQIPDVHTGDEQQERDRGRQRHQHRTHVAEHRLRERRHVRAGEAHVARPGIHDREELVARRLERRTASEARDRHNL